MTLSDRNDPPAPARPERWIAFVWGLAEAMVFFIVPDVLLTRVALHDLQRAVVAACWAVAGALIGGTALWLLANSGAAIDMLHFFEKLPGINRLISFSAASSLHNQGVSAFFTGSVTGVPYKLLVTHAAIQGMSLPILLGVSLVARAFRFFGATLIAWLIRRALPRVPLPVLLRMHAVCWFAFYVGFFLLIARGGR